MLKEIDPVFLHHDASTDEFYCLKCGYTANEPEIRALRKWISMVRLAVPLVPDSRDSRKGFQ